MEKTQIEEASLILETHPEPLIFDKEGLFKRTMDDENFARHLIAIYLIEMSECLKELSMYVERRDFNNISSYAHNIKGASANIGGMALSSSAAKMEKAAIECEYNKIVSIMPDIEKQFDLLTDRIKEV
ncbi:MAG: Hpt domain-containing protein [Methanomethylovorans sp.]|uniref:Hpt domain-containing protein n=1 Tax=Methanomethylovorans sp. TaxID=2758717 RepID=UPI0035307A60